MDNLKPFNTMGQEDNWRTQTFRQNVVTKIEEAIQRSGMQVARNSSEMENHVFKKAKTREEYMNMVAKLILHVRDYNGNDKWTMPEFSPSPPHIPVDIKLEQSEEEESCEPPKKKKRIEEIDREESIAEWFLQCRMDEIERQRERDARMFEIERERIRQKDRELEIQAQWLELARNGLRLLQRYLIERS